MSGAGAGFAGLEVWRGAVNAWECDEMGHMNVRFYLAHAQAALAGLAAALDMPDAFAARASSTLLVREHHVRFLREAQAGAPLHIDAGVLEIGEQDARVLLVMRHSRSGEPCASFVLEVVHTTADGRSFAWSPRARQAAEAMRQTQPAYAGSRGVPGGEVEPKASLAAADALGLPSIARGPVLTADCDALGRLRPDAVMGRFSDGAAQLFGGVPRGGRERDEPRLGGALLEIRILHFRAPRAGAHLWLRSGLSAVEPKFSRITHWLLDPVSGEAVASARGIAAALDLDTRKVAERSHAILAELRPLVFENLGF